MNRKDKIIDALKSYKMWSLQDDEGNGYPLLDHLSFGPTVKAGLEEIQRLAEHIDEELGPKPVESPDGRDDAGFELEDFE